MKTKCWWFGCSLPTKKGLFCEEHGKRIVKGTIVDASNNQSPEVAEGKNGETQKSSTSDHRGN
jgi:hypothetical protein